MAQKHQTKVAILSLRPAVGAVALDVVIDHTVVDTVNSGTVQIERAISNHAHQTLGSRDLWALRPGPRPLAHGRAARLGDRITIVEPQLSERCTILSDTGAPLIPVDSALAGCETMIVPFDQDIFKSVHAHEWARKIVCGTRSTSEES